MNTCQIDVETELDSQGDLRVAVSIEGRLYCSSYSLGEAIGIIAEYLVEEQDNLRKEQIDES